jgi:hypothetical protein
MRYAEGKTDIERVVCCGKKHSKTQVEVGAITSNLSYPWPLGLSSFSSNLVHLGVASSTKGLDSVLGSNFFSKLGFFP